MENFHGENFRKFITLHEWKGAADILKSIKRTEIKPELLNIVIHHLKTDYITEDEERNQLVLEVFRFFRNAATSTENQDFLCSCPEFVREIKETLVHLLETENDELLLKVLLQFLVNLIVSNEQASDTVSNSLYKEIRQCLHVKKNTYEVLALLYNIHLQNRSLEFEDEIFKDVLNCVGENSSEFAEFLTELFFSSSKFWQYYKILDVKNRISALEVLKSSLIERKNCDIQQFALVTLAEKFANSHSIIFQTVTSGLDSQEPYEVALLLEILGCICANEKSLLILQENKDLLINSSVILINIHRLGQASENHFSSIQKLSELKQPSKTISSHPMFGFKVGLIRLIGNLCWKSKRMQDLVREAEIIPVLLDCCNIDARNPLIIQWVILAIRNLCEKNPENQAIIAGLHKEGVVTSALVEEMGLNLHSDSNGVVRIVPLDLKK